MECPHCGKEIAQAEIDKEWEDLIAWGRKLVGAYEKYDETIKVFEEFRERMPGIDAIIERIRQREIEIARIHTRVITGYPAMWSKN